jgi:hypothetical protein
MYLCTEFVRQVEWLVFAKYASFVFHVNQQISSHHLLQQQPQLSHFLNLYTIIIKEWNDENVITLLWIWIFRCLNIWMDGLMYVRGVGVAWRWSQCHARVNVKGDDELWACCLWYFNQMSKLSSLPAGLLSIHIHSRL